MLNELHKKDNQLILLSLIIIGIIICIISIFVNYFILREMVLEEAAPSHVYDGEFLKISHPIKIGNFAPIDEHPQTNDPDGGFFVVTVKNHEYIIYKNSLSHRFGMSHYPDCPCFKNINNSK